MAKQIQSFGMSAMTIGACSNFHTTAVKYINEATPAVLHIEDKSPAVAGIQRIIRHAGIHRQPQACLHHHTADAQCGQDS